MNIFKIFKKDLKNIVKNPAAIGIIIGLCIIPSFYTWITLKANWNPYVDTGNVPVAVVNDDMGTIINGKIVNFGDQTVDELKQNNTIKWTFVGDRVAEEGLKDGQYYAVVKIPSDFSDDLKTIYTGNPIKPDLIYKVNEKTNAIATKITDLATNQLQQQIKESFFYNVNKAVLTEGNKLGKNIKTNKPMILEVKDVISNTNQNVQNIINSMNGTNQGIGELGDYIGTLKNNLPEITKQINNLEGIVGSSKYLLSATQSNMSAISSNLNATNTNMQNANNSLSSFVSDLKTTIDTQMQDNAKVINAANQGVNAGNQIVTNGVDKTTSALTKGAAVVSNATKKASEAVNQAKDVNTQVGKALNDTKNATSKVTSAVNDNKAKITSDINKANNTVNDIKNKVSNSPEASKANDAVNSVKSDIANNPNISKAISDAQNVIKQPILTDSQIGADKKKLQSAIDANKNLGSLIDSAQGLLDTLNKLSGSNLLGGIISELNNIKGTVQNQSAQLNSLNDALSSQNDLTASNLNSKLNSISQMSSELTGLFNNFTQSYSNTVNNTLSILNQNITNSLNNVSAVLMASKDMIPQLNAIANVGISSSNLTVSKTNDIKDKLDGLQKNLSTLESKTKSLTGTSLDNLVSLLEKNPTQLSSILSSPVNIKIQELYGMSIFGIGLAPFYTVLSIWVGALLCTTIIGVNSKADEDGTKKRILEIHFARMLLFIAINFVQATIVTLGDVFLLGIKPADFWMLMGFAWFTGIVFTVIIFTLVSLNGNFGKAAALVIMVVQVAGSGSIYPIEVNPIFFQKLEFLWPFTYAVDGFRQAIGGAYWPAVEKDIIALLIFLALFIVLGISKMFISKQIDFIEGLFKQSEL